MSLLEDIQNAAVDPRSDLGTILRKCKVLAARLGSTPLEDWLLWESNGYPEDVGVPSYRIWPVKVKGNFSGYAGASLRNVSIPWALLPADIQKAYQAYECRQSIGSIEDTLRSMKAGQSTVTVSTSDLALALGTSVYEHYNCIQAWGEFPAGHLYELLNIVRNRILDFALALWKQSATAGELTSEPTTKIQPAQVNQIFEAKIYGGSPTVVGFAPHSSIAVTIVTHDFESLERALREKGLSSQDTEELQQALAQDAAPTAKGKFGPKVSAWVGKMVQKAGDGTWDIAISVAGQVLYHAIAKYYGWQ